MSDNSHRSRPERPPDRTSRAHVGWREILTRAYLPQLLTLCLAIWLHAANSMLTATTLPGGRHRRTAARELGLALYLMGSRGRDGDQPLASPACAGP